MGFYDLDTSISYALKVGRQEKLSYVCISFGCTLFFIATIEQPTLNHHIESAFALAPSTFLAHMKNPFLKGIVSSYHLIVVRLKWNVFETVPVMSVFWLLLKLHQGSAKLVGVRAFADANFEGPLRSHLRKACLAKQIHPSTCQTIFSRLDVVRDFFLVTCSFSTFTCCVDVHDWQRLCSPWCPKLTATSQLEHLTKLWHSSIKTPKRVRQEIKVWNLKDFLKSLTQLTGDSFRAFDYGSQGNLRQYGTLRPPSYDLSRVTAPVYIFWSQTDVLATPEVSNTLIFICWANVLVARNLQVGCIITAIRPLYSRWLQT